MSLLEPEILQLFIEDDLLPSPDRDREDELLVVDQGQDKKEQEIECCFEERRQLIGFTFLRLGLHWRMDSGREKNALNTFQIQSLAEITEELAKEEDSDKLLLFLVPLVLLYPRDFHRYIYLFQIEILYRNGSTRRRNARVK